jgi:hypothetical protein
VFFFRPIADVASFLVALLHFFCKLTVFDYEGTFIATVKAFPDGRTVKDEKIDVCRTAFWTALHPSYFYHLLSIVLSV